MTRAHLPVDARPRPPIRWNSSIYWVLIGIAVLIALSFWTLDLQLARMLSIDSAVRMGKFLGELLSPNLDPKFLSKLGVASLETLAMSALGSLIAACLGLLLALPASKTTNGVKSAWYSITRFLLNAFRSIPELVWAALLLISAGLGPFVGTLALALHTTGVLGRLFAESIENAPQGAAQALRIQGVNEGRIFRAAAVLGVVGGGGLGQMLAFHMGLFQMSETSSILIAMIILVVLVDALSYIARRLMSR